MRGRYERAEVPYLVHSDSMAISYRQNPPGPPTTTHSITTPLSAQTLQDQVRLARKLSSVPVEASYGGSNLSRQAIEHGGAAIGQTEHGVPG